MADHPNARDRVKRAKKKIASLLGMKDAKGNFVARLGPVARLSGSTLQAAVNVRGSTAAKSELRKRSASPSGSLEPTPRVGKRIQADAAAATAEVDKQFKAAGRSPKRKKSSGFRG